MKLNNYILAGLLLLSSSAAFADVSVPFGEGSGKADFINTKRFGEIEDPFPFGPLSFRTIEDKVWVADSVGGKLMQFSKDNKLISEFSILQKGEKPYSIEDNFPSLNVLIEDFAPVRGEYGVLTGWWVIDGQNNKLIKFSVDGNKLAEINNEEFAQLFRVEVSPKGYVFVADKMLKTIFTFDAEGNLLNKQGWEWSGMAISNADEKLYRLVFDENSFKHVLVSTNLKGEVVGEVELNVVNMFNPNLCWVDEAKNECVITYTPETGFEGKYNVVRIGLDGALKASGTLEPPFAMNRFIDHVDYEEVFIGKGNFDNAPEGNLEIVPFKLP